MIVARTALQRCLNSPYLWVAEGMRNEVASEFAAARQFLELAQRSFGEQDEATGLKQAWAAMFRAARGLVYNAGYGVDQLRCMEVVLEVHYPAITGDDIIALRRAQELVGPPDIALERARQFVAGAEAMLLGVERVG
jgi:hypothetical protein